MKESHGSVEVNALASAREINDKGIYSVGNLSTSSQSACRKVCCSVVMICEVSFVVTVADIKFFICIIIHQDELYSQADS